MSALPFTQVQEMPDAIITSNGNHLTAVAAARISRDAREIEQLPFDPRCGRVQRCPQSNLEIIGRHLGYDDLMTFAMENLLASPGATVMAMGKFFQIFTLVPNRRENAACRFLTSDDRCSIHALSPYACSQFDSHQSKDEADRRSLRGLQAIAREWAIGGLYARIWVSLYSAGLVAPSPIIAREEMRGAKEN